MRKWIAAALLVAVAAAIITVEVRAAQTAALAQRLFVAAGNTKRPVEARLQDARAAARLRPDVVAYYQRAASLQATRYVELGELQSARELLIDAWGRDRSAMYLREQLREVNNLIFAIDSRKAHVLHGREGPGGVLEPEDLMP